jgi:hypothetical protein
MYEKISPEEARALLAGGGRLNEQTTADTLKITAGSIGAQFNEGVAQTIDIIPKMGNWILRQFDSSTPPLGKDPGGVRTALRAVDIPVGTLEQQKQEYGVEEGPVRRIAGTAARIAGQSAPLLPIGPAAQSVKAMAGAATLGAAGREAGDVVGAPETGEMIGSLVGGFGAPVIDKAVRSTKEALPKIEQIYKRAEEAYKRATDAGVVVSGERLNKLAVDSATDMAKVIINPTLHPKATAVMAEIAKEATAGPMSLDRVEVLRRVVSKAMKGADDADQMRLFTLRGRINEMVDDLAIPGNTIMGNASVAPSALKEGRANYAIASKAEFIEDLVTAAKDRTPTYSASGFERALINEFKKVITNPQLMKTFTPAEQASFRLLVRGSGGAQLLRQMSRLAPQNILSSAAAFGAVGHLVDPTLGGALVGAGLVAREASKMKTAGYLKQAQNLVVRGFPAAGVAQGMLDFYGAAVPLGVTTGTVVRGIEE